MPSAVLTFQEHIQRQAGKGVVHKFRTADGTYYDTWNADLATQVRQHLTQPVEIEYQEQPGKSGFVNYTIQRIAGADSSATVKGTGDASAASEPSVSPAPGPRQTDWEAKDQRITRSFAVNASLKALEIAGGDKNAAEQLLKDAIELAYLPSVYAWSGPQK